MYECGDHRHLEPPLDPPMEPRSYANCYECGFQQDIEDWEGFSCPCQVSFCSKKCLVAHYRDGCRYKPVCEFPGCGEEYEGKLAIESLVCPDHRDSYLLRKAGEMFGVEI